MTNDEFYKNKTWELIMKEMNQLYEEIKILRQEVGELRKEINDIRGIFKWTAGIFATISFILYFLKDWLASGFKNIISKL
jgi:endonuclease III-like uncharacterized protein